MSEALVSDWITSAKTELASMLRALQMSMIVGTLMPTLPTFKQTDKMWRFIDFFC